jgi:AraC-like DNA-binding protein
MEQKSLREKKQLEYSFPFLLTEMSHYGGFPPHWHDCFEVLYICKGQLDVSIDDTMHEVYTGDVVLINAGTVHGFLGPSSDTTVRILQFDMAFFDNSFLALRDTIFNQVVVSKKMMEENPQYAALSGHIQHLCDEIALEYRKKNVGWQLTIKSQMYELMMIFLRKTPEIRFFADQSYVQKSSIKEKIKIINPYIRQIQAFVFNNFYDPDINLEEAAQKVNLSKFYFTRFFKKYAGQSFHSYLAMTRVNFAKHYLTESDMTVLDIAFQCGFGSLQTFNRVFKTYAGITPSTYRAETRMPDAAGTVLVKNIFQNRPQRGRTAGVV